MLVVLALVVVEVEVTFERKEVELDIVVFIPSATDVLERVDLPFDADEELVDEWAEEPVVEVQVVDEKVVGRMSVAPFSVKYEYEALVDGLLVEVDSGLQDAARNTPAPITSSIRIVIATPAVVETPRCRSARGRMTCDIVSTRQVTLEFWSVVFVQSPEMEL